MLNSNDPPALHQWREHAMTVMIRLSLVLLLPLIIVDVYRLVGQRAHVQLVIEVLFYTIGAALILSRRIPYIWIAFYVLSSNLLFSSYLLLTTGLVSAGRVYIMFDLAVAAVMFQRRSVLIVWLSSAVGLLLSCIAFIDLPPAVVAILAQRLTDPCTFILNALITLIMGAIVAIGITSLINSLAQSLRTTEQALAERDLINSALEQRVAERTGELEQALMALRASEAKYKTLFQTLPVGVLVVDDQGQYAEYNQITSDLFAFETVNTQVRRALELNRRVIRVDGSPLPLHEYPSMRAINNCQPITCFEAGIIDPDRPDQVTWISVNMVPLHLPHYGAVVVFSDITAHKCVEVELLERERFIKQITDTIPDVVYVYDIATSSILYINPAVTQILGYTSAQIVAMGGALFEQLTHPDDRALIARQFECLIASTDHDFLQEIEYRIRHADGSWHWMLSRNTIFARTSTGVPSQILGINQDITASKQTEHALAASEARLRALRDALPDPLFIVHANGTFLEFFAPRHIDILVLPESFLGRTIDEVLPAEVAEMVHTAIARVRVSGRLEVLEDAITFVSSNLLFEIRIVPITDDELLFVVRDITAHRQVTQELLHAKEAAEAADRAKSTFLAHISHEIRTPLTAIIGMASLLCETQLSSQQREYVTTIRTGAETLLTIIGNILDFSKIEASEMELIAQPFDLRKCLKDALDLVVHQAKLKNLALECVIDEAVPEVLIGDRARLHQVLVNLVGNAVKFTERGTVVLLVRGQPCADAGFALVMTIRDTGIGIASHRLSDIFDPFVQADNAITRRYGGTGLGLAISKQLVELMGGQITVESYLGEGSIFTLSLPLPIASISRAELYAGPSYGDISPQRALHVLLAEDNLVNQTVLRRLLERLGYLPDIVADGIEALAAVHRKAYDVVLMDIQMPELDGETATRRIRALEDIIQPYIIAITASALRGDRERYLAAGMDDYLSKPVQLEDLRTALARCSLYPPPIPAMVLSQPDPVVVSPGDSLYTINLIDWIMLERLIMSFGGIQAQAPAMVLDLFGSMISAQISEITAAILANERSQARALAHKLRGGSRQLGAVYLADVWRDLEMAAQTADQSLAEILHRAHQAYDETLVLLTERLNAGWPESGGGSEPSGDLLSPRREL
ncbi:MAG: PAS domain S-box protein [Oscillochloris sp.]|nr:PAS domain S-box protein [Oscillochloris sp.]